MKSNTVFTIAWLLIAVVTITAVLMFSGIFMECGSSCEVCLVHIQESTINYECIEGSVSHVNVN